jgi:hypothetical protein
MEMLIFIAVCALAPKGARVTTASAAASRVLFFRVESPDGVVIHPRF